MPRSKTTFEQQMQMVKDYKGGKSVYELGDQYEHSATHICRILDKHGVQRRSGKEASKITLLRDGPNFIRKYGLAENFFSTINTPEKARWLGFIASDGCICNNQLIIQLQDRDRPHLEFFANSLRYTGPIANVQKTTPKEVFKHARLVICSAQIVKDLLKNGITPSKSKTLKLWNGPKELMRFWWAGMFDGDGTISK